MSNDWQQLTQTWQAQAVDVPQLKKQTRWKTVRMWLNAAMEVAIIFYVWAVTYWLWPSLTDSRDWQSWMIFWSVATPLMVWFSFRAKRGLWRATDTSLLGLLSLKRQRAEWGVRGSKISIIGLLISAALVLVWTGLAYYVEPNRAADYSELHHWWPVFLSEIWILGAAGLCAWYRKVQQRKLRDVDAILQQYENP